MSKRNSTKRFPWLAALAAALGVLLVANWLAAGNPRGGNPQVGAMRPGAGSPAMNMQRPGGIPARAQQWAGQGANAQQPQRGGIAGSPNAVRQPMQQQIQRPDLGLGGGQPMQRPGGQQAAPSMADLRSRPSVNMQRPGMNNNAALAARPDIAAVRPGGMQPGAVRPAGLAPNMNRPDVANAVNRPGMPTMQIGGSGGPQPPRPGIAGGGRPGWGGAVGGANAGDGNIPGARPDLGGRPWTRPVADGGNRPGPNQPDSGRADGGNRPDWANRPDRPGGGDRPGAGGDRPGPDRPDWANRPGPNRPDWANRPRPNWNRPGGNNINSNNTNVTNINNWTSNNQAVINNSPTIVNAGYRPGVAQPGYGYGYQGNWGYGATGFQDNSWQCGPGWQPAYRQLHDDWCHGSWNGYCNNANNSNWLGYVAGATAGWVNSWTCGSRLYSWGYSTYSNPYLLTAPQVTTVISSYDYSQPINTEVPPPDQSQSTLAANLVADARAAFKNGNYDQALSLATQVMGVLSNDRTVHEFRALNLFALGRFDEASQALYPALSVGPGWDWTTMVGLYPDEQTYSGQFTTLENFVQTHPNDAAANFLLAYHYIAVGATDAAADELRRVVQQKPNDRLSRQMLALLEASQKQNTTPGAAAQPPAGPPAPATSPAPAPQSPPPQAAPTTASAPAVAAADLSGKWQAKPDDKTTIALSLQPDGAFEWAVSQDGASRQITGKYTLTGDVLTLVPQQQGGGAMVGSVVLEPQGQFAFRIVGAPAADPGLAFARQL